MAMELILYFPDPRRTSSSSWSGRAARNAPRRCPLPVRSPPPTRTTCTGTWRSTRPATPPSSTTSAPPTALPRLPPGRDDLFALFAKVYFHPLSIGLLTEALKDGHLAAVSTRLDELLAVGDGPLIASLNLSLERVARSRERPGRGFAQDLPQQLNLTQQQFAGRLGVAFVTLNRWENGQARPSAMGLDKLRRATGWVAAGPQQGAEQAAEAHPAKTPDPQRLDFLGDPQAVRVLVEGERLSYGHLFNPAFATEISAIDPLPHQRIAVYDRMLPQARLRFLLADDAGAGKTITTSPGCSTARPPALR